MTAVKSNVFKFFPICLFFAAMTSVVTTSPAQESTVLPTQDGGRVSALLYGEGERGVVLVHGGRFKKESWEDQARILSKEGFRVISIDLRGFGESTGLGQDDPYTAPMHLDVLTAVRYLRSSGSKSVSVVGASMGGWAAADASILSEPGEIDRIVILAASINGPPEKLKGRTMYAIAQGDTTASGVPRLVRIREQYERTPQPKELLVLDGSAHAQYVFQTSEGDRLMREIVRFLLAP
ncbi:MAG: alpha/beta hydrolase [Bacteroidota bacterium]